MARNERRRQNFNEAIEQRYTLPSHPIAFSSPANVYRAYKGRYKLKPIRKAVEHVYSYALHKQYTKPRVTNPFFVYSRRKMVQVDLIDLSKGKEENDGVCYLMVALDIFTKFMWVETLKNKNARSSFEAMRKIIAAMGDKPEEIFFDRG
jgi:hypothetical protein